MSFRVTDAEAENVRSELAATIQASGRREYAVLDSVTDVVSVRIGDAIEIIEVDVGCLNPMLALTDIGIMRAADAREGDVSPELESLLWARRSIDRRISTLIAANKLHSLVYDEPAPRN